MKANKIETRFPTNRFSKIDIPTRTCAQEPIPQSQQSQAPKNWQPGPFDYQRLDVHHIAKKTLVLGYAMADKLPRGYGKLADQLKRALLSSFLGIAEAASRTGADRKARYRCARGEASESAAATEAILLLGLGSLEQAQELTNYLARQCAMLTKLAQ